MAWGIDDDTLDYLEEVFDDFLVNWGKDCTLVYPPTVTPCDNCIAYPGVGGSTLYHHRPGGPILFSAGIACPLCQGSGKKATEATENIRLLISEDAGRLSRDIGKYVKEVGSNLKVPAGAILVKGLQSAWPQFLRADYIIMQLQIDGFVKSKYRRVGTGTDAHNILAGRYFICLLERI